VTKLITIRIGICLHEIGVVSQETLTGAISVVGVARKWCNTQNPLRTGDGRAFFGRATICKST
jgi:hypothetical protein